VFKLADYVKVANASLEKGLLSIDLVREIPEQLKPRRIAISAPARTEALGSSSGSGEQISQDVRPQRKVAA
jgi:molecular chaperone IbpA